ncbi:MAG: DUF192 domain-containing protein [Minisyncoccia bacterium]
MIKKNIWAIVFLVIIFVIGFFVINYTTRTYRPANIKMVTLAEKAVVVDVALSNEKLQKGLSGREGLGEDEGMLFVFENPGRYPFWMKDMNFPIDIIWIGEDLKVVYVKDNATPGSYPESFDPGIDAKYVLEVVAGFSEKNNLKPGNVAVFTY